jgi:FMN phosphatase YigB (HAD superfamily)
LVRAVVFDVGETLVDETRAWAEWADWLGVPRLTLMAAIGAVMARGEHHRRAFDMVRPGIDMDAEIAKRRAAGSLYHFSRGDLYPDAVPCLEALRAAGYRLAVGGNQPLDAELILRDLGLPFDVVAASASMGIEKPSPAFFRHLARLLDLPPGQIAYVGDRLDNDVSPAKAAGMVAVFLRRGPWGLIQSSPDKPMGAAIEIDSLLELPDRLARL